MNNDKFAELQAQILQLNVSEKEKSSLLTTLGDLKHTKILRNPQYILEDTVKLNKVKTLEKFDIITSMVMGIPHPCIVYKVDNEKDLIFAISFTTNEYFSGNIMEITKSRFFEKNFATATLVVLPKKEALKFFKIVFDNKSEGERIFYAFRNFYKNLLKL